jgi:hypothetical protein
MLLELVSVPIFSEPQKFEHPNKSHRFYALASFEHGETTKLFPRPHSGGIVQVWRVRGQIDGRLDRQTFV